MFGTYSRFEMIIHPLRQKNTISYPQLLKRRESDLMYSGDDIVVGKVYKGEVK